MTHTPPKTPEWEIKLNELEYYFRSEEDFFQVKSVLKYHIDELLSDHDRELVEGLEKMRQKNVDNNISGKVVNEIESYEEALTDAQEFIKKGSRI